MNALEIRGLRVHIGEDEDQVVVLHDTTLAIPEGETLALVGESGSGKTMTALTVMGLLPPGAVIETGEVVLAGRSLLGLSERELRDVRGRDLAMIFQDPMTSLNPMMTVGRQLAEVLEVHEGLGPRESRARCARALGDVGIGEPEARLDVYPHELSGGMRQRVMIAMALLCEPKLLIADEPTTALDVTIQAQILELMRSLQERHGTAILLISHDLGVVAGMAHRVGVTYAGRLVETGTAQEVLGNPYHPYTFGLLRSVPTMATPTDEPLPAIPGTPPEPSESVPGCAFQPRCPFAVSRCVMEEPQLKPPEVDRASMRAARMLIVGGRKAACFERERVAQLTSLWITALDWDRMPRGGGR